MPKRWTIACYWQWDVYLLPTKPWWAITHWYDDEPHLIGYLRDEGQDARVVLNQWEAATNGRP